jgi:hypothetical protein
MCVLQLNELLLHNNATLGDAKPGVESAIKTLQLTLDWQKTLRKDILNYWDPPAVPQPTRRPISAAPIVLPDLLLGLTLLLALRA